MTRYCADCRCELPLSAPEHHNRCRPCWSWRNARRLERTSRKLEKITALRAERDALRTEVESLKQLSSSTPANVAAHLAALAPSNEAAVEVMGKLRPPEVARSTDAAVANVRPTAAPPLDGGSDHQKLRQ